MKKRLLSTMCLLPIFGSVLAQKVAVSGFVKDSETTEAMLRATVQVMSPDTTKMIAGTVTNNIGGYTVKNIPAPGSYVVKISYIGYHDFYKPIQLREKQTTHNVGTSMLIPSTIMLQTAVVTGVLQQSEVKEDTVLFNADAFKIPEGSALEELIKKIPGAEVDDNGAITVNGKKVRKILVKGKEFFNNDTQMAMKNLPADIIEKVKVYDKKSDNARITGIDDGEEETVIDLTPKKGMDKGWFGNIDMSVGTHERWGGRTTINRFADKFHASIVENLNSTGVQQSTQTGLNLSYKNEVIDIGGNVRYNTSKNDSWSKNTSENYVRSDMTTFSNRFNKNKSHSHSFSGDMKIEWKIDSMTTLLFRPDFSLGDNDSWSSGQNARFNKDPYLYDEHSQPLDVLKTGVPADVFDSLLNDIINYQDQASCGDGNSGNASGQLTISRRFVNKRNISFRMNGNWNESKNKNFNASKVTYNPTSGNDSTFLYRYRTSPQESESFSTGFSWNEPMNFLEGLSLQLNYTFSHSKRNNDSKTYDMGDVLRQKNMVAALLADSLGYLPEDYLRYEDEKLSRFTDDINNDQNIQLGVRYNTEAITSDLGMQFQPQHQRMAYRYQNIDVDTARNFFRMSPTLNFRYRFTRQHYVRFRYRGSMGKPSLTDLIDLTDDSDPLRTTKGNPDLKPSFTNNFSLEWNNYITARMQNFNANIGFETTDNSISNKTEYNPQTGHTTSYRDNINGRWSMNASFNFGTPLFTEHIMLNTNTNASYNNNVAYIQQDNQTLKNTVVSIGLRQSLRLTYRRDHWDVSAYGNINYGNSNSELVPKNNKNTYDFSYGVSSTGNFTNGFGFNTSVNMSSRRGYDYADANTDELIWNAQVSYRFLKGRKGTVSLQAFDILHTRSNISRQISATSRNYSENSNVYSYYMVHLIYRFNLFGTAKGRKAIRQQRRMREMSDEQIRQLPSNTE